MVKFGEKVMKKLKYWFIIFVVFLFFLLVGSITSSEVRYITLGTVKIFVQRCTDVETTITVRSKERVRNKSYGNEDRYKVFAEKEVFECTDAIAFWHFNADDVYNHFEKGKTYTVRVVGLRWGFLSWNRNIIEVVKNPVVKNGGN